MSDNFFCRPSKILSCVQNRKCGSMRREKGESKKHFGAFSHLWFYPKVARESYSHFHPRMRSFGITVVANLVHSFLLVCQRVEYSVSQKFSTMQDDKGLKRLNVRFRNLEHANFEASPQLSLQFQRDLPITSN